MICGNEAYIIEISARCGATCIPELISIHYGVDYYGSMVSNALGENVSFPDKPICAAIGELLRSDKSGIITSISYNEAIQYADQISFDYQIGDSVNAFRVGPDRIGQVIVHGDDLQKANMNLENAKKHICVDIRSEQET